jgi:hypothetical protein
MAEQFLKLEPAAYDSGGSFNETSSITGVAAH